MKRLLIALAFISSVTAQAETVFVQDNRADENHVLAFNVSEAGQLSGARQIATQGKGFVDPSFALGPFDSDQEVITNPEHTLLLTVNGGSNSISVFALLPDGQMKAVPGSPFASHGSQPVSLGLNGHFLTVVNKHGDPAQANDPSLANYTNFSVQQNGALTWIPGSTVSAPVSASPSQALVHQGWPLVFGADFLGGNLQSFRVAADGTLKQNAPMMVPADLYPNDGGKTPHAPLGLAVHPHRPLVYVGLPTINKIGVYRFNRFGVLTFVRAIADSGQVVCWLATNKEGTRLYASNTMDSSLTVYDLSTPDEPVEMQKLKLETLGGTYQIALNPSGTHLGVVTQRFQASTPQGKGNEIHILAINPNGTLSPRSATSLDLPGDTRPQGIVFK